MLFRQTLLISKITLLTILLESGLLARDLRVVLREFAWVLVMVTMSEDAENVLESPEVEYEEVLWLFALGTPP